MPWVAGVDGCRKGWVVVLHDVEDDTVRCRVAPEFRDLLSLPEAPAIIAVDMIIGLPDLARRGGRACDQAARRLLGRPRASSVFSPPTRAALQETDYRAALAANRAGDDTAPGISIEAFHLFPKIREVDKALSPDVQRRRVREAHPELSFCELNGGTAMRHNKRTAAGRDERGALLTEVGFGKIVKRLKDFTERGVGADDILDACAVCWTSRRVVAGKALCVPPQPPCDARGLRMEIWR